MSNAPVQPELTLFHDGACPLCRREVRFLKRRDTDGRIGLVDIASPGFDPEAHGLTREAVHARMHAIDADGNVIEGMEVFRRAYRAVGMGWLWAPTGWPLLRPIFDGLYRLFAKVRPRLPGRKRCDPDGVCRVRD